MTDLPALSSAMQQEIEILSDLLSENTDLNRSLKSGLSHFLSVIDRMGGAIFVRRSGSLPPSTWIKFNIPDSWADLLNNPSSDFSLQLFQVMESGQATSGRPDWDMSAMIPILFRSEVDGVILVRGTIANQRELQEWQSLARPFGRAILTDRLQTSINNRSRELEALKIIATAQNADLDINGIQLVMVKGIKDIFHAQSASLLIIDDENPELALKKVLIDGEEWATQESIRLEQEPASECIQKNQTIIISNSEKPVSSVTGSLRDPDERFRLSVCTPLISNAQIFGYIELTNPPKGPLTSYEHGLMMSMATALANTMWSMRLFQRFKVTNADLEASRWELIHSRNTLRTLFDSIPSSIYIVDKKYNLIAINKSRSERAHSKPSLLVGKKCFEALFQRNSVCPGCRVHETMGAGKSTLRFSTVVDEHEQIQEWEINTFPIQDSTEIPMQVIVIEQDVTEKKRLEANLVQSEKLAAVGQLAAGVAHEINNPLAAVIANAQMLRRMLPPDNQDAQEMLQLIETAGSRASQVVQNLLGFARKEKLELEYIDINENIQKALALLNHEIVSRRVHLILNLEGNLPLVTASSDHLQGVWTNLIMNAIDAMNKPDPTISIQTRYSSNEIMITVQDNGSGISEEKLGHVFEPFFTTKAPGKGTGLGLSVCHRVVKQHGGSIHAESQIGKGTRFTVTLPVVKKTRIRIDD